MKREIMPHKFDTLTEAHRAFGLPNPKHPLITVINGRQMMTAHEQMPTPHVLNFFKISYKPKLSGRIKYGQGYYDFDEGGLLFAAPNQIIGNMDDHDIATCSDFAVLIHPDFLLGHPLSKKIKQYGFFSYSANEGLHLSDEEKTTVLSIFQMIENELNSRIDDFSHDVILSQLELLLNFSNRFYKRQFITRKAVSNDLLSKLEKLLDEHFDQHQNSQQGLPTVAQLADHLNVSPSYLSDMLRSLIGQNAQQFIHSKLIDKAKEKLSTTSLSVSEVAFELGFEHSQSFSKLFKTKTKLSPLEFRRSFN
ncbi:MAG: helix-turn-helix transcriptional regulator [Bacteroidota bacterium]